MTKILWEAALGGAEAIEVACKGSASFVLCVRSVSRLDQPEVNETLAKFGGSEGATREQIEFIDLIVDHQTRRAPWRRGCSSGALHARGSPKAEQAFDNVKSSGPFEAIKALNWIAVA